MAKKAVAVLSDPDAEPLFSSVSVMEIAMKAARGGLPMPRDDIEQSLVDLGVETITFGFKHAWRVFTLPGVHEDPFDRMLIATALSEEIPIISSDAVFTKYKGLRVIWK